MKKMKHGFFVFLLFPILQYSNLHSQQSENPNHETILKELRHYAATGGPEKVYVHTDKEFYAIGETIWFKTYLVDGISHTQSTKSKIAYVELWNEKDSLVALRKLHMQDFGAAGDIKLNSNLQGGIYTIRAYTKYMMNEKEPLLFHKQIPIWDSSKITTEPQQSIVGDGFIRLPESAMDHPNIEFFPEGGDLVCGLENIMGIKATDKEGNGLQIQGKILDESGNPVAFLKTFEFGLGQVHLTPEIGKKYFARIDNEETNMSFPLPKPLAKGYMLNLRNKGDHILVKVTTNNEKGLQGLLLLGHLRGEIIYENYLEKSYSNDVYQIKLSTKNLKSGVAEFTLFAHDGEPLCERLVFLDTIENLELVTSTEFIDYGIREPVSTTIALKDKTGEPVQGELSVSVVSSNNNLKWKRGTSIRSWLLLDSDLGGKMPNPDYFFKDESSSRKQILDLLMLTHGWRRFVWKDFRDTLVSKAVRLEPEKGLEILGKTTFFNNNSKSLMSQIRFTLFEDGVYQEQSPTNANGEFSFGPFILKDSARGIIEAVAIGKKRKPEVAIYLDSTAFSIPLSPYTGPKGKFTLSRNVQDYLETVEKKKKTDFEFDPKITQLEEVTVIGVKKTKASLIQEKADEMTLHYMPTRRLFTDSLPGFQGASMMDMLRLLPGSRVLGIYPYQSVTFRAEGGFTRLEPRYVVDGVPVSWEFARSMSASQVLFLDLVQGGGAAVYGARGGAAVVAIYTKSSLQLPPPRLKRYPGVAHFTVSGVYKAREFYSPNYAVPKKEHEKPDYRTTLHWVPRLTISNNGLGSFSFHTGDSTGEYIIKVEGITRDGRPVEGISRFTVTDEDSKM
ncbi:TonB-dependent receptor [Ulvibacterium sp.]|uniref:TonB-dependent receptor n=1 Tax=Ulvibacterium sp. TaxID=2665914 RepID=UPI0026334410|nr:Plug domain-containing protein [Ulvibacterium sp.]